MSKNEKDQNLDPDINSWCFQIKDTDLVIFEKFNKTNERSYFEEDEEELDEDPMAEIQSQTLTLYQTPWGPVKVPEFCEIDKHFKLWTMYTRKPIGNTLKNNIDRLDGVETFEIFTPYRARIGICPLYKDGEVLNNIKSAIENCVSG